MWLAPTGFEAFDKATDEAFAAIGEGRDKDALETTITALSNQPVEPEDEEAKRKAIADMRMALAGMK